MILTCSGPECHRSALGDVLVLKEMGWVRTETHVYCPQCTHMLDELVECNHEIAKDAAYGTP